MKNGQKIGQKFGQVYFWDALKILKIEKKNQKSTKKNNEDYPLNQLPRMGPASSFKQVGPTSLIKSHRKDIDKNKISILLVETQRWYRANMAEVWQTLSIRLSEIRKERGD